MQWVRRLLSLHVELRAGRNVLVERQLCKQRLQRSYHA
jgi:hypothetical protein